MTTNKGSKPKKQQRLGDYILSSFLGKGAFGKVVLGTHVSNGKKVAIKFLGKTKLLDLEEAERLSNEFFILTCIKHPNIVRLWEVVEDVTNLYLIMEYAGML